MKNGLTKPWPRPIKENGTYDRLMWTPGALGSPNLPVLQIAAWTISYCVSSPCRHLSSAHVLWFCSLHLDLQFSMGFTFTTSHSGFFRPPSKESAAATQCLALNDLQNGCARLPDSLNHACSRSVFCKGTVQITLLSTTACMTCGLDPLEHLCYIPRKILP